MLDVRKVKAERPRNIKWRNEKAIIALLQNNTELTIPELAERLELSKTATTQIVNELCEKEFLKEAGVRESTTAGGKPPRIFTINASFRYSIISIIANDYVECCITNMKCKVVSRRRVDVAKLSEFEDWNVVMETVIHEVEELLEESQISMDQICMMAVGCGGIVDQKRGMSIFSIGTKRENDFPIGETLQNKLNPPFPIVVDNVGRFLGYAELMENPSLVHKSVVSLFLHPTGGFGGCVIEHGELLYGRHGYQGEFGHLLVETHKGRQCICGNRGCLESMISPEAVREMWENAKDNWPEYSLEAGRIGDVAGVLQEADKENPIAKAITDEIAVYVSRAIYNIILMYDPQQIIIQGLLASGNHYFSEKLKELVKIFPAYGNAEESLITFSKICNVDEGFVMGAALYVLNTYLFANKHLPDRKG